MGIEITWPLHNDERPDVVTFQSRQTADVTGDGDGLSIAWPPPPVAEREEQLVAGGFLQPAPDDGDQHWVGICRLGGVGDDLIAASVLRPIRKLGYKIEFIAQQPHHVVLQNNPFIDKLSVKDGVRDLPQGDMLKWQEWFDARGREYDHFVNLSHSCESLIALFPAMSAYWWPAHFRRQLCARNYLEAVHDIVGVPHDFGPLYFPTTPEKQRAASTKAEVTAKFGDGRMLCWVLSGTRIDKVHPHAPMVIARIIKELQIPVVMIGAPGKDFAMAKTIMEIVQTHNGSVDGLHLALSPDPENPTWPLRRCLALAHASDIVVTPDTGPAWAVAFEDMPKVAMVSHASPRNITDHWRNTITLHADPAKVACWPCHRLHDNPSTCTPAAGGHAAACMDDLSVELIVASIRAALGDGAAQDGLRSSWASRAIVPVT